MLLFQYLQISAKSNNSNSLHPSCHQYLKVKDLKDLNSGPEVAEVAEAEEVEEVVEAVIDARLGEGPSLSYKIYIT